LQHNCGALTYAFSVKDFYELQDKSYFGITAADSHPVVSLFSFPEK
jgi:hypothetical protein